ncbi:MAG TPA: 16S rRNA (adenine(1518)-N(6)/adenine(1519)-N(6))-dimethyltransferase RsmA [Solirubrobacteraceae bacterium]|nr:16S rRNA (adenine(1518)-N(6)/adenine(1519)-N(6))-dimethyltransferase RsmA [Solirubrobacteraceae bacterium]
MRDAAARGQDVRALERTDGPVQPTLRRLREFGVRPDGELGQNFLIDSNILGVMERVAELARADVVLEVGGGVGVLSERLAERCAHVHVVEVDERLREALADAVGARANVTVHWADAMRLELAALEPAPTKVVANLPYGVAAGVLLRSIELLGGVRMWVAMVQREVGERLAARAGTPAYGVPSVLAQLACEVEVVRAVPRSVFHPVPNVDSVLVRMRRRGQAGSAAPAPSAAPAAAAAPAGAAAPMAAAAPAGVAAPAGAVEEPAWPALRALVAGAFAHRRKTLAGSLAIAAADAGGRGAPAARSREHVRAALERLGQRADVRAERLAPEDFRALARELGL